MKHSSCISTAQNPPARDIEEVLARINYSYRHNAHARFPYPKCSEGTREEVLAELLKWAQSSPTLLLRKVSGACWLRGSAGVGKSAIAQTVAEKCEKKELLASFFFSRVDPNRNHPRYLVLAIAHGISISIPSLRNSINRAIKNRPQLLQASLEAQIEALVVKPLLSWKNASCIIIAPPALVVIDGLDECLAAYEQQQVLSLAVLAMKKKLPMQFLICSRPEPQIRERFNRKDLRRFTESISLDGNLNANRDIEVMLRNEFKNICMSECCSHRVFPDPWPTEGDLEMLVDHSSGQFIYPTTVIKF
ncbi:hypothetical protein L218DRAFT_871320, partial [Marasmius fiardii PR-910]